MAEAKNPSSGPYPNGTFPVIEGEMDVDKPEGGFPPLL